VIGGVEQVAVVGVPRGEESSREVRLTILVEEPQRRRQVARVDRPSPSTRADRPSPSSEPFANFACVLVG